MWVYTFRRFVVSGLYACYSRLLGMVAGRIASKYFTVYGLIRYRPIVISYIHRAGVPCLILETLFGCVRPLTA